MSATTLMTANLIARFCPVEERKFWKYYMRAYEECLSATSTQDALWCIKENARLIVLLIILVIALLGGFSGLGGEPFYGTRYYGGGGLGLILIVVLILVLLGKLRTVRAVPTIKIPLPELSIVAPNSIIGYLMRNISRR
jgi:hypothetical protein